MSRWILYREPDMSKDPMSLGERHRHGPVKAIPVVDGEIHLFTVFCAYATTDEAKDAAIRLLSLPDPKR